MLSLDAHSVDPCRQGRSAMRSCSLTRTYTMSVEPTTHPPGEQAVQPNDQGRGIAAFPSCLCADDLFGLDITVVFLV